MKKSIVCLAVALFALTGLSHAQNLLLNSGFEDPLAAGGNPIDIPHNWFTFAGGGGFATRVNTDPFAGSFDLSMGFTTNTGVFAGAYELVTGLVPGQQLTISGYVRSDNPDINLNQTRVRFEWRNSTDAAVGGVGNTELPFMTTIGTTYSQFSYNVTVPNNVNVSAARVVLAFNQAGGTTAAAVSLDNISLTTVAVPEPASTALGVMGVLSLLVIRRCRRHAA